jgi:hypothetical protein
MRVEIRNTHNRKRRDNFEGICKCGRIINLNMNVNKIRSRDGRDLFDSVQWRALVNKRLEFQRPF